MMLAKETLSGPASFEVHGYVASDARAVSACMHASFPLSKALVKGTNAPAKVLLPWRFS